MIFKILLSRSVQTSCPLQTFVCNISRHLEFRVTGSTGSTGSLDSRVTGSLRHTMWPSSMSGVSMLEAWGGVMMHAVCWRCVCTAYRRSRRVLVLMLTAAAASTALHSDSAPTCRRRDAVTRSVLQPAHVWLMTIAYTYWPQPYGQVSRTLRGIYARCCSSPFFRPWARMWTNHWHGHCDARPTLIFPAAGYHRP